MALYPGAILQNRYQVDFLISQSDAGELYRVTDLRFSGQRWVVKILKDSLSAGLEQSTRILLTLRHSHLVKVVDFFEKQGLAFFVMESVEGPSLAHLLQENGPLPRRQVLPWVFQAIYALLVLHEKLDPWKGYWNLSPRKMLITQTGEMKLIPPLTNIASNLAPRLLDSFVPPEVFEESDALDERAEIYSLAAILYQALSGQDKNPMPFDYSGIFSDNQQLYSRMKRILGKAAQPEPKKRYRNLRIFRKELTRLF